MNKSIMLLKLMILLVVTLPFAGCALLYDDYYETQEVIYVPVPEPPPCRPPYRPPYPPPYRPPNTGPEPSPTPPPRVSPLQRIDSDSSTTGRKKNDTNDRRSNKTPVRDRGKRTKR